MAHAPCVPRRYSCRRPTKLTNVTLTTFDEEQAGNPSLDYWMSRPPEERIAEVERSTLEYWAIQGHGPDEPLPRLADLCSLSNADKVDFLSWEVMQLAQAVSSPGRRIGMVYSKGLP